MWLRRTKSTAPCPTTSPTFARSSFKDIESLFADENQNHDNINNENDTSSSNFNNNSPKSQLGTIFHRVRRAKLLFWALTSQPKPDENAQKSLDDLKSFHHADKDGSFVGNVNVDAGVVRNQENVRDSTKASESLDYGFKDNGVPPIEDNVQESVANLRSLHHGGLDRIQENDDDLMQTPKCFDYGCKDDGVVPIEDNVQESIETLESLQCGRKDDEVVGLDRGVSEGNQCLIEDATIVGDEGVVPVEDNVQESIQTIKSLESGKDDGIVSLERLESEDDQCLIEEATAGGEVGGANVVAKESVVPIELPGTERRVVIFFTSLRVVRSTFLDCKYVRTILHSFDVAVDERDLFMDGSFMVELQRIMGNNERTDMTLPQVFIGGRYFGGAEEIRKLHEAGELKQYMEGMAPAPAGTCEVCGGHGFILCLECNGSHKRYADKGSLEGGYKTCTSCNENGLVRCPSCSSVALL